MAAYVVLPPDLDPVRRTHGLPARARRRVLLVDRLRPRRAQHTRYSPVFFSFFDSGNADHGLLQARAEHVWGRAAASWRHVRRGKYVRHGSAPIGAELDAEVHVAECASLQLCMCMCA